MAFNHFVVNSMWSVFKLATACRYNVRHVSDVLFSLIVGLTAAEECDVCVCVVGKRDGKECNLLKQSIRPSFD